MRIKKENTFIGNISINKDPQNTGSDEFLVIILATGDNGKGLYKKEPTGEWSCVLSPDKFYSGKKDNYRNIKQILANMLYSDYIEELNNQEHSLK